MKDDEEQFALWFNSGDGTPSKELVSFFLLKLAKELTPDITDAYKRTDFMSGVLIGFRVALDTFLFPEYLTFKNSNILISAIQQAASLELSEKVGK